MFFRGYAPIRKFPDGSCYTAHRLQTAPWNQTLQAGPGKTRKRVGDFPVRCQLTFRARQFAGV